MPKQQSKRIAARHHELARRKKAHHHGGASAVAEPAPAGAITAVAASTPAPTATTASATAKSARQILTPDVRYLKSDFMTLALLTGIVVVVLVALKVLENQGILLR